MPRAARSEPALSAASSPSCKSDCSLAEGALSAVLRRVYELYADLVLKNPFYELEMPIRVELFDEATNQLAANPAVARR